MAYQPTDWEHGDIITGGKLNKIEQELTHVADNATYGFGGAQLSSDGLTPFSYINAGDPMPANPQKGDTVFLKDGNDFLIYSYNGEDWVLKIDPDLSNRIEESIKTASDNTDKAIADNNTQINETINQVAKEQADLAIKDADFNEQAQAMADKALSDAKANTVTVAQETLNSANQNIAAAKSDLTDGLQKEVSDRTSAVNELDTKAQGYVSAAKTDVLKTVNKEVTDRQNAVTELDTKAQDYANTAKTDALNALTEEVTNRQNAVSALDTKATNAVNQAKSDINDTINALSVGGRNYLLNSNGSTLSLWTPVSGWQVVSDSTRGNVFSFTPTATWTGGSTNSISQSRTDFTTGKNVTVSFWAKASVDGAKFHSEPTGGNATENSSFNITLTTTWKRYSYTFVLKTNRVYFMPVDAGTIYYLDDLQLETGNMLSDYKQAPEDVVLDYTTKDNQIKETITQYKDTNDGKVGKAQTDATTALGLVATKVSQTDFDTKTGDLSTKYTQVKQTTDSQATDIVDIKKTATNQASKINSISSDVDGTKQSISDIETTQDSQSDKINQITSDVNGTKQSITDIQSKDGQQDTRMGNIETSVSGVKSEFSTYKTDANGRISTAQTTAQTAVDGLKNKVSQTDYNTKTGQLQTDLTTTTQTANQAKIDIVSIKQKDSDQDAKMNTIVSDANGTKQTVSDLKTAQGKQSGDISTLQQRADGFDATVTKVDNLSVGGRNYVLNSSGLNGSPTSRPTLIGATSGSNVTITYPSDGVLMTNGATNKTTEWYYQVANAWTNFSATPLTPGTQLTFSADVMGTVPQAVLRYGFNGGTGGKEAFNHFDINNNSWTRVSITFTSTSTNTGLYFRIQGGINNQYNNGWSGGETLKFRNVKIESGNTATDWTPAPEDLSGATAKAQLTADQATTAINTYRTSNDGRVASAESKITQNATDITQKVSKTDYNQKTGQLQTDLNTTTNTANTAKQDIATIKTDNTTRDSKINTLESDSTETKRTISKLSGDLSTVSGDVSTLTQRADGFDATVTKVDNLAVGGRNYLISGTAALGWLGDNNIIGHNGSQGVVYDYISTTAKEVWSYSVWSDKQYTVPADGKYLRYTLYDSNKQQIMRKAIGLNMSTDTVKGQIVVDNNSAVAYIRVSIDWVANGYGHAKFEKGNIPTDWSPAPEDVDSATAKAQLTADNATTALSNYKTDADGRISKAQSDIVQTAKDVTTKVSQSDYNKKTGDLTTAVAKAQTTADGAVTTVGNYKTSNDGRVQAAESKIEQNSNDITARVTKTDYDKATGKLSGDISTLQQRADGFDATVTKVDNLAIGGRNYFLNSSGTSLDGWSQTSGWAVVSGTNRGTVFTIKPTATWGGGNYNALYQTGINIPSGTQVTVSFWAKASVNDAKFHSEPNGGYAKFNPKLSTSWTRYSYTFTLTTTTIYFMGVDAGTIYYLDDVKIETGNVATDWAPAPEDVESALAQVKLTADGVSSIVSNPTTGLSTRVQTAEGTLSKVKGTDIPALQNATFWQPYSSLNFNDYTKQGSIFFNTTAAKTNGPTTSTAWTYLMVEQGTSDNGRIKQTSWYDGVNGVKITYVRTLNSGTWSPWYANDNDSVTTISQTNSNVTQEIADRKTGDSNTLQSSKDFTTSSITSAVNGVNSTISQTSDAILANISATNLFLDSEFNQDYAWRSKSGTVSYLSNQNVDNQYHGLVRVVTTTTGYQGYWAKNIPVQGGSKYSGSVRVHLNNNGVAAGFALYDLWFVDKNGARISTGSGGSVHFLTKMVSSPYWVDLWADGITAPINAVYAQISLLAAGGVGMTADFTMPTFTATDVHQPYTPNDDISFQLGLFKDNWSIGITDNISKITSGIVSNASQMSIISKNVTIDSPSTQITGTAWINSAMIQNGSIANANIADAAITSAKIATLDVAKLTGNVSNFIQSNWNGLYQSVKISPIGMTISTSQGSTAQFNQDGLVLDGALGTTNVLNGQIELISSANEYLGTFQHETMPEHDNVDYLMIKLAGWHTSKPGDSDYDLNADKTNTIRGGDGIGFGVTNSVGTYDMKMSWDSSLVAGYKGRKAGWHVEDIMTWHQPTYFEGGFDVAQQFGSGDRRALHIQGSTLSNKDKWYGFFDTGSQAGFGTTASRDVVFYVAGKSYSLYTMLHKLNMYQD